MAMTDSNATERLLKLLDGRGVKPRKAFTRVLKGYINPVNHYTHWNSPIGICSYHENESADGDSLCFFEVRGTNITPEQAVAATLGNEPDEIELTQTYDAGFKNGVMAVFQQLEGIEDYEGLQDFIAEYWTEGEGYDEP